jgi:hypothetical protein
VHGANRKRRKIGRNDPCPCGNGKKFKHCHGSIAMIDQMRAATREVHQQAMAMKVQRERQQGLGTPIISAEVQGTRFVAVRNRLLNGKWKTFHDFLLDYIKIALGSDWGNAELKKAPDQRHPVLIWYDHLCTEQRMYLKGDGRVSSGPLTGAIAAYMWLAYDLYCLDHNVEIQNRLLERLRDIRSFAGARYEVFAAATLVRAGFELEFENEDFRGSTHCEFTATSRRTGKRFSVECKRRDSGTANGKMKLSKLGRKLRDALTKSAHYDRIVFLEVNVADRGSSGVVPKWIEEAARHLKKFETNDANGGDLPSAYIFFTNYPYHHFLREADIQVGGYVTGFKLAEFTRREFASLRDAINAREAHADIHHLVQSIKDHSSIPPTFDGEIPEFAFGEASQRLLIGRRYLVKDGEGNDRVGVITSATVAEHERKAYCGVTLESGESKILSWPLSDAEMAAWKRHPDTFFGVVGQRKQKAADPLELYDFFLGSYSQTPKVRLLELLDGAPDRAALAKFGQPELASVYAERCVYGFLASVKKNGAPQIRGEASTTGSGGG